MLQITSKSKSETPGSTSLAVKIRFCEAYYEDYLSSSKIVQKSSYILIAITGKSAFETLELASNFAEPLSYSGLKIRFCKAHREGYPRSPKMVQESSHILIAIRGKSAFETLELASNFAATRLQRSVSARLIVKVTYYA